MAAHEAVEPNDGSVGSPRGCEPEALLEDARYRTLEARGPTRVSNANSRPEGCTQTLSAWLCTHRELPSPTSTHTVRDVLDAAKISCVALTFR